MKRIANGLFLMFGLAIGTLARPWMRWLGGRTKGDS